MNANATPPSLSKQTRRGFGWLLFGSLSDKALSIGGQVALLWFLAAEDFGLVGMAFSIMTFAGILQTAGVREVVIQRGRQSWLWENVAFWMSLTVGLFGALATIAMAGPMSRVYDEPRIVPLLMLAALDFPLRSLTAMTGARLESSMRFGWMTATTSVSNIVRLTISITLAVMGFGAWALIIPLPIATLTRGAMLWYACRPKLRWNPQFAKWRLLWKRSGLLIAVAFGVAVIAQSDYFILGTFFDTEAVGLYFVAFQFASQTIFLLSFNAARVLLPALSHLRREPERQRQAFMRACRTILLLMLPVCFVQAALAEPLFKLLFEDRWLAAVPLVAWLSVGMGFQVLYWPAMSYMKSQGRNRSLAMVVLVAAAGFVAVVWSAARLDELIRVAQAVALFSVVYGLFLAWIALGGGWRAALDLLGMTGRLGLAASAAALAAWYSSRLIPLEHWEGFWSLLAGGAASLAVYGAYVLVFERQAIFTLLRSRRGAG